MRMATNLEKPFLTVSIFRPNSEQHFYAPLAPAARIDSGAIVGFIWEAADILTIKVANDWRQFDKFSFFLRLLSG